MLWLWGQDAIRAPGTLRKGIVPILGILRRHPRECVSLKWVLKTQNSPGRKEEERLIKHKMQHEHRPETWCDWRLVSSIAKIHWSRVRKTVEGGERSAGHPAGEWARTRRWTTLSGPLRNQTVHYMWQEHFGIRGKGVTWSGCRTGRSLRELWQWMGSKEIR